MRLARRPPIEIDAAALPPLGMAAETFLQRYWQKHPLLIRNAFPGFVSPIAPEDLAGLACEEAALARLIRHHRSADRWEVRHGPFAEADFPGLPDHDWTLLVQDVDKWDADIAGLLAPFGFLPRWRIDDVMVSFAASGGSVGAHVDQYDVFLLQAQGRRRWQIDAQSEPPMAFRDDVELKLLRQFAPSHDWVLEPGDMLYLPPGVPHHGVALDPCLTFSIGMRAPSAGELAGDHLDDLLAQTGDALRYQDPDLAPVNDPFEIDANALERVAAALAALQTRDPERLGDWFGRFITTYRSAGEPVPAPSLPPRIQLEWRLAQGDRLLRHPWSRTAWQKARRGARLYCSGLAFPLPARDAASLAAAATLDGPAYTRLSQAGQDAVHALFAAGHYHLEDGDDPGAGEPTA